MPTWASSGRDRRLPIAGDAQPFPFAQLEYAGRIGLGEGRYLAREGEANDEPQEVLVVQVLGAPRPGRRRRRARPVEEGPPAELSLTRVTAVRAERFSGQDEAASWLEGLAEDPDALEAEAEAGLVLLNRALAAQRAASGDPYVHELSAERAVAIRIGYGSGEQLAEGRFSDARELEPRAPRRGRRGRQDDLRPQERVAAVLGARESLDACETLLARARVDLDAGRTREAALQLRVGLEALLAELRGALADPGHEEDMAVLTARRGEAGEAANAAVHGELDRQTAAIVKDLLEICERVLRRRRVLRG